jgi:hypothetical protein
MLIKFYFLAIAKLGLLFAFSILEGCMTNTNEEKNIVFALTENQQALLIEQQALETQSKAIWEQDLKVLRQLNPQRPFDDLDEMSQIKSILFLEQELILFSIYYPQTYYHLNLLMDFYLNRIEKGIFLEQKLAFLAISQVMKYLEYLDYPLKKKWLNRIFSLLEWEIHLDLKIGILNLISDLSQVDDKLMINPLQPPSFMNSVIDQLTPLEKNKFLKAIWLNFRKEIKKGIVVNQEALMQAYEKNPGFEGEMILIAGDLQLELVNDWCAGTWWDKKITDACQEGLSLVLSKQSFELLIAYLQELIKHQKKMNIYDIEISMKFNLLLGHLEKYQDLIPRAVALIDLFLTKNRSSDAIYAVIDMLEHIKPRKEALALFLRYEKWTRDHMSNQPQGLTDRLRKGIRRLYEVTNMVDFVRQD